ncbi:MAG TPA: family 78 glycoside hydrolase catalytic domain [Rhodothermales bacterium]|nr:family 78 glycoside hydrolase catalytic domain [Rhodothermales bacterium]
MWRVRVWDEKDVPSEWSPTAFWEMGLLDAGEWEAEWISPGWGDDPSSPQPPPMLRRAFELGPGIRSARLYVTALGLYEAYLNGNRVGDDLFTPGWTSYNSRLQYQVYDVTDLLRPGANAIGAILGDGWYRGWLTWEPRRNVYGDRLALLAQLRVEYEGGVHEWIRTDDRWTAATSPILMSDIYMGEIYDARLERPGWSESGFDDGDWLGVEVIQHPHDILVGQIGPPVRRIEEIAPVTITRDTNGRPIVDFGQNMVGWVRLRVNGSAGSTVVLRHAEVLDAEGNLYVENLRKARQEVRYTLKGLGDEVFEPHFTFQGFRYVSVEGYPGEVSLDSLTGVVVHSDLPRRGRFACSNPSLNRLYENIVWSQKGNFLEVPTDCPQRDERLGWTGDAQVFAETAALNMEVAGFFTKWLRDLAADQRDDGCVPFVVPDVVSTEGAFRGGATGWADAAIVVPWTLYRIYGDKRILESQYDSMTAWIAYMHRQTDDDLIWRGGEHFGDWLSYRSNDHRRLSGPTDNDLIAAAYFAYSTLLVAETARVLGRHSDVRAYDAFASELRLAFVNEFVTAGGRLASNTQTAYVLALAFDLLPRNLRLQAADRLVDEIERFDDHLTTGFLGTPLLLHVLTDVGRTDVAYDLLLKNSYPSWLYPITKGATTIWEHWDGIKPDGSFQDPGMNSYNHYGLGAVGSWLYQIVAGIRQSEAEAGFRRVVIFPEPGGGLTSAEAELNTMYGRLISSWTVVGDRFRLTVAVPPNVAATVVLPCTSLKDVTESGIPIDNVSGIALVPEQQGRVQIWVSAGRYEFECPKS